jgi:D-alanyl-D-alanine carboxypeptidase
MVHKLMEDERFVEILSAGTYHAVYQNAAGETCEETYTSTVDYVEDGISQVGPLRILGGKTGTTSSAGHCLVLIGTDDAGEKYLTVVLKAKSHDGLYEQIEHIVNKIEK